MPCGSRQNISCHRGASYSTAISGLKSSMTIGIDEALGKSPNQFSEIMAVIENQSVEWK